MDFADQIKQLIGQLEKNKDLVFSEEATKTSMVMPFLKVLGYDIHDPTEVVPEYAGGIGVRRDQRLDYAIVLNKEPIILIEAKTAKSKLQLQEIDQLQKYFVGIPSSRFAILTNGLDYQFFSDFDNKNIMDKTPFFEVSLTTSIRDSEISQLRRFHKNHFNADELTSSAKELKHTGELKRYYKEQFTKPEEDFIKFLIKKTSFSGSVTKPVVEKFSRITQAAFKQYINESVSDALKDALDKTSKPEEGNDVEKPSTRLVLRKRFWTQLLGYAKTKTDLHAKVSPTDGGWVAAGAGISGLAYCYTIARHNGTVQLFIGRREKDQNETLFDKLFTNRLKIEDEFGGPLEWDRMEGKNGCKISKTITIGGYLDEQAWPGVQEELVRIMIKLKDVLAPELLNWKAELS